MELNQRKLLSLKSWKELAAKGEAPEGAVVLVSVDLPDVKHLDEAATSFVLSFLLPIQSREPARE